MPISLPQLMGLVTQAPMPSDFQGGARTALQAKSQNEMGRSNLAREDQNKEELSALNTRHEQALENQLRLEELRQQFEEWKARQDWAKRRDDDIRRDPESPDPGLERGVLGIGEQEQEQEQEQARGPSQARVQPVAPKYNYVPPPVPPIGGVQAPGAGWSF